MIILDTEPVRFTNTHLMEAFVLRVVTPRALNSWHMTLLASSLGGPLHPTNVVICSHFLAEEVSSFPV